MVLLNSTLFKGVLRDTLKKNKYKMRQGYIDSLVMQARGGDGGHGLPKFGGVGGKGGDVVVVAKEGLTLSNVQQMLKRGMPIGGKGVHSSHNFVLGQTGKNMEIEVPTGVTVYGLESGQKLGEVNNVDDKVVVAHGGVGGSPRNAYMGRKGEEISVLLDLKLIADIGLVGFPNAGKSTFLKAVSLANPKVAAYPFTTIRPNVGTVQFRDFREITVADLPGLIEGAYANIGLGHRFLKHVERTKLMLLIADINGFQLSRKYHYRTCLENVLLLNRELELYNKDLLLKPTMLLINKMDTEGAQQKFNEIKDILQDLSAHKDKFPPEMCPEFFLKFTEIMPVSMKNSLEDADQVKYKLRDLLDIFDDIERQQKEEDIQLYDNIKRAVTEVGPRLT